MFVITISAPSAHSIESNNHQPNSTDLVITTPRTLGGATLISQILQIRNSLLENFFFLQFRSESFANTRLLKFKSESLTFSCLQWQVF